MPFVVRAGRSRWSRQHHGRNAVRSTRRRSPPGRCRKVGADRQAAEAALKVAVAPTMPVGGKSMVTSHVPSAAMVVIVVHPDAGRSVNGLGRG